jgi:hypothetical protein
LGDFNNEKWKKYILAKKNSSVGLVLGIKVQGYQEFFTLSGVRFIKQLLRMNVDEIDPWKM